MKKILVIALPLIAGSFMVFNSCKEDEYYYLSEEFKSYVVFPVGTYWVYEEINSGFIDTLIIENISTYFRPAHSESNNMVELGNIEYNTSNSGKISGYLRTLVSDTGCLSFSSLTLSNESDDILVNDTIKYMDLGNEFFCCCDSGKVENFNYRTIYFGILDNMDVNSLFFENVMIFNTAPVDTLWLQQYPNTVVKSYFAKNAGLIKWEQFNGNIWEIRDYKINN